MGLKDLAKLFTKKNIVFGILFVWLLAAYIFLYFGAWSKEMLGIARLIFFPLLIVCMVLFIYTAIFRGDVRHFTKKNLAKASALFGIGLTIYIISAQFFTTMIDLFTAMMFVVSIFSYILITAIFSMNYCFEQGVKLDDTIYKAPNTIAFITRWGLFLLCILTSLFLIWYGPTIVSGEAPLEEKEGINPQIALMLYWLPLITIGIIVGLALTAIIVLIIKGKFNAWLGIYFFFLSCYVSFLMIGALFIVKGGNTLPIIIARYLMFGFDMFLLLITIGSLVGKKAEVISKKLKFINSDAILIWLIFSKAAYEYAEFYYEALGISSQLITMKSVAIFYLVIPLMVVMAIYGIIAYGKIKAERVRVKKRKIRVKKSKKKIQELKQERKKAAKEKKKEAKT